MSGRKRNRLGEFFWSSTDTHSGCRTAPGILSVMHLRMPSIDRGVQSFLWATLFLVILYFGMVVLDVQKGTALIISLVSAFLIFLFVRTHGT